jgi:hypothetical protein
MSPVRSDLLSPKMYELVGASALVFRVIHDRPPSHKQNVEIAEVVEEVLAGAKSIGIADQGSLIWTAEGLVGHFAKDARSSNV